ncbi:hypothetical protein [Flavobacterium anhuiense]|uniref:hypothetical protein n=1 Tax=Flavobacterium anhuiense TaxID=459526 RepID=UPI000E6C998D|nr:hypothetical protein [Flavobacterium anhuiense]
MPINKNGFFFTTEEVEGFKKLNVAIDGSHGGMLLGNYHSNGGIPVLKKCDDAEMYQFSAEFEGWEYLLCAKAVENNIEYLTKINLEFNGAIDGFDEYRFPENVTKINTFLDSENTLLNSKFLILGVGNFFIVNKFSTKKYIKELDVLNKKYGKY